METYCVSCNKINANQNFSVKNTKENRLMFLSNCAVCGKKNQDSLEIKNFVKHYSRILVIFKTISLR